MRWRGDNDYAGLFLFLLALAFLAALTWTPKAAYPHDHYTHWRQANGASCCNERVEHADGKVTGDCEPVEQARRIGNGAWLVIVRGVEVIVPPEAVRPYSHELPDVRPRWCGVGQVTYCFVPAPEGL